MLVLPAIDMMNGKVVIMPQGDFNETKVFEKTPLEYAKEFKAAGAEWIHIVDLDGVRDGGTPNAEAIREIIKETGLKVELGGGIRNMQAVETYARMGVRRLILGTAAIQNEDLVNEATRLYGSKIAVGADVKDGYVFIKGWTEQSAYTLYEVCTKMSVKGVSTMVCTDVRRDGSMEGPNRTMYRKLCENFGMNIIAAGGISTLRDVEIFRDIGLYGVIIRTAYYEGKIDLAEAIEAAKQERA